MAQKTDKNAQQFAPIPDIDFDKLKENFQKNQDERIKAAVFSADVISGIQLKSFDKKK